MRLTTPISPPTATPLPTWLWVVIAIAADQIFGIGKLSFWHWNIAAGLFFACLWLAPKRAWWWMVLFLGLSRYLYNLGESWERPDEWMDIARLDRFSGKALWLSFIGDWGDLVACLLPVAWLRRVLPDVRSVSTPEGTAWLHLVVFAAASLQAGTDLAYVVSDGWVADVRASAIVDPVAITAQNALPLLATFGLKNLLGYFLGTMLAVPLVAWLVEPSLRRGSAKVVKEALVWMAPVALVFVLLSKAIPNANLIEFLRLLLLVAVVVFAAKHGWRGAVISVLAVSIVLAVEDHMAAEASHSIIWMQLFVAISGAMALMFGSSLDHLRLALGELRQTHLREQAMARELADAVGRNVRATEVERGRVATELHDSVGQSITALQTQLKLVELDAPAQNAPWISGLRSLVTDMRLALGEAIEALRPSALNELGLFKAMDRGSIRQQAERAGLRFSLDTRDAGALTALDEAASVAAYRIVQEAVNNVVRHAGATQVRVRLNLYWRRGEPWLVLAVEDDGKGFSPTAKSGNGLRNMRDRALMLGGGVRIGVRQQNGTRVRAWLRAQA